MERISKLVRRGVAAPVIAVLAVFTMAGLASATTADPISSGFTSLQTTLTTYLGDAIVFVVAIAAIAIGIRLLVKWAKRAASS
jgi:hypothetical protein